LNCDSERIPPACRSGADLAAVSAAKIPPIAAAVSFNNPGNYLYLLNEFPPTKGFRIYWKYK